MTEISTNGHAGPKQDRFDPANRIRIAQLALGQLIEAVAALYVEGVVSLIWPYSNKHNSLSLLLAEPDVRLRSAKGQLKVTFHGLGAREVASSKVGIGDVVRLRLEEAKWMDTGDAVLTPGRKVEWDLHFTDKIVLDVRRDSICLAAIDYEVSDTSLSPVEPALDGLSGSVQVNGYQDHYSAAFSTPASIKRISSGSFIAASLDPFTDDNGFLLGKGRKRTKFGRISSSWKLVVDDEAGQHEEELPAASPNTGPESEEQMSSPSSGTNALPDVIMLEDESSAEASPVQTDTLPPVMPDQQSPEESREALPSAEDVRTPELHHLASPDLPMVSPVVKVGQSPADYFDIHQPALFELVATTRTDPEKPVKIPSDPVSGDLDGPPPSKRNTAAHAQPHAFVEQAAASPSAFSNRGFVGSGTTLETSTDVQSFSNSFGLDDPRTVEQEISLGLSPTDTSPTAAAKIQEELVGSQDVLVNDMTRQEDQCMEAADMEEPIQSPNVQNDLETFHYGQNQSDDDDMYGPAQPTQKHPKVPSVASVVSSDSDSLHQIWQDRPDNTALDQGGDDKFPPSFPLAHMLHDEQHHDPPGSWQPAFLDGVSDGLSKRHEDIRTFPEMVAPQIPPEEVEFESIDQADVEVVDAPPEVDPVTAPIFEAVTETHTSEVMAPGSTDRPNMNSQTEESELLQDTDDDEDLKPSATAAHVLQELKKQPSGELVMSREPSVQESVDKDFVPPVVAYEQLFTPDNTQQDAQDFSSHGSRQQTISLRVPPTPDNSQEPAYAELLYLDGTNEHRPPEQDKTVMDISLPAPEQERIALLGASPEDLVAPALSSPYLAVRRSTHTSPERQLANPDNGPIEEDLKQLKPTQEIVTDESCEKHDSSRAGAKSPPHEERINNMLGMATPLSYYTALSKLNEHYGQQVDVLAICTADSKAPTQSKAGPKDYNVTLHLTDSFLKGSTTITAQLFRPYKAALPVVQCGEAVLLRSLKVQSQNRKTMLLSTDSSAWMVFSLPGVSANDAEHGDLQVEVPGPQVEYGSEERVYAKDLLEWWESIGRNAHRVSQNSDDTAQGYTEYVTPRARATGHMAKTSSQGPTNKPRDVRDSALDSTEPSRTTRSSTQIDNRTSKEDRAYAREQSPRWSPVIRPTSPTSEQVPWSKTDRTDRNGKGKEALEPERVPPTSPVRMTRSSRRYANRTDHTANEDEQSIALHPKPLNEIFSPKNGLRTHHLTHVHSPEPKLSHTLHTYIRNEDEQNITITPKPLTERFSPQNGSHSRRSNHIHPPTPELSRSLRTQSTVHELRDGTRYVDGHVPTKRDVVHELRNGTKYVDETVSTGGRTLSVREEDGAHELRDVTNYLDRSKSQEVRRSARSKKGGTVVHEPKDGSNHTDD